MCLTFLKQIQGPTQTIDTVEKVFCCHFSCLWHSAVARDPCRQCPDPTPWLSLGFRAGSSLQHFALILTPSPSPFLTIIVARASSEFPLHAQWELGCRRGAASSASLPQHGGHRKPPCATLGASLHKLQGQGQRARSISSISSHQHQSMLGRAKLCQASIPQQRLDVQSFYDSNSPCARVQVPAGAFRCWCKTNNK